MGCEESARVSCPMVAARRVSPGASACYPIARGSRGCLGLLGICACLWCRWGYRAERAERCSHCACVIACVSLGRRANKTAASFALPHVVLDRRCRDGGPASVFQSPLLQHARAQHFCLSPGAWPACQCHLLKLFLTAGHCVNIPTSPRVGRSILLTRREMASSQDLLWILGTHGLGLGDGPISCGHHPVLWGISPSRAKDRC